MVESEEDPALLSVSQNLQTRKSFVHSDLLSSFNVEQGLQDVGLEEYSKQGEIESATSDYLDHQVQKFTVAQCAENMSTKTSLFVEDFS
jgi:hypothetical protein